MRGLTPNLRAYIIQQNLSSFDKAAQAARQAQEAKLITSGSQSQPNHDSLLITMVKTVTELSETVQSLKQHQQQHHKPRVTIKDKIHVIMVQLISKFSNNNFKGLVHFEIKQYPAKCYEKKGLGNTNR